MSNGIHGLQVYRFTRGKGLCKGQCIEVYRFTGLHANSNTGLKYENPLQTGSKEVYRFTGLQAHINSIHYISQHFQFSKVYRFSGLQMFCYFHFVSLILETWNVNGFLVYAKYDISISAIKQKPMDF